MSQNQEDTSIQRSVLLTKTESEAVDRLLSRLEDRAGCRVSYGTLVRALMRTAFEAEDQILEEFPVGLTLPPLRDPADVEAFEAAITTIVKTSIRKIREDGADTSR